MTRRRTALLVDDERLARAELRALLAAHPEIEIVGEAESVREAAALAARLRPDAIFLDVQLRGETGFDLLASGEIDARVVFVTAHDAHALRAFDVNALDYLLKPVAPERLAASIARLAEPGDDEGEAARRLEIGDFVFVPADGRPRFLRVSHIVAVRAAGDATTLLLADGGAPRVPRSLRAWEARLPERQFVRIHRESLVNLQYVERIEEWSHDAFHVHLRGRGEPLVLSRRFAARLRERFA